MNNSATEAEARPNSLSCVVCGNSRKNTRSYPSPSGNVLGFLKIEDCTLCGLGVASPSVDQTRLDNFYREGGYWHPSTNTESLFIHQRVQARVRVESVIEKFPRPSGRLRVLDVGAGHAFIADAFENRSDLEGIDYFFFEPDEAVATGIVTRSFTRVSVQRVLELPATDDGFDIVFLNQVLEHVAEPNGFLKHIKNLVRPNGILYVEVPNRDDRFKPDVFPHTLFFTKEALARLASALCLTTLSIDEFGGSGVLRRDLKSRVLGRLFQTSVDLGFEKLAFRFNRALIDYRVRSGGIWLRGFFRV